jgi:hypothetical protein
MADLVEYEVAREHLGNKITDDGIVQHQFEKGDTRLADPAIVKHLIGTVLIDPNAEKAEPAPENKAEGNAAKNKGAKAS